MIEMKNSLPKHWKVKKFEEVLDYIQPTKYIVSSTDYSDSFDTPVLTAGKTFILGKTNEKENIFQDLPVIIFDDFTTANKFVNFPFKVKSSAMKILKPKQGVNIKFVHYFMQTVRVTFDTHKRYWISVFAKEELPYPPLEEQQAIVQKIEELFSELDNSIENLKTAQQQIKTYRQSVLKSAFEGKLTQKKQENIQQVAEPKLEYEENRLPEGWKWVKIEDVIQKLEQGWSPKCENYSTDNEDEWAVIKTTAIQHSKFLQTENKKLPLNLIPREKHELKVGDILITRAGPRVRVGVCCQVKNVRPKLLNCDKAYRIRLKEDINPNFFEYLLNSPKFLDEIEKLKTGISDSGVNLTQNLFKELQIPLPEKKVQDLIIAEIESRLSVADKLEEAINQSLEQAEVLRQSILKKAFEGKLIYNYSHEYSSSKNQGFSSGRTY